MRDFLGFLPAPVISFCFQLTAEEAGNRHKGTDTVGEREEEEEEMQEEEKRVDVEKRRRETDEWIMEQMEAEEKVRKLLAEQRWKRGTWTERGDVHEKETRKG